MWHILIGTRQDGIKYTDWTWNKDYWESSLRLSDDSELSSREIGKFFLELSDDLENPVTPKWLPYGKDNWNRTRSHNGQEDQF